MLQFEISETAERALLDLVDWFGQRRALRITDAYDWIRESLREFPELGTAQDDGRTRVLVREELRWIYEVLPDRIRLLNVIDPRWGRDDAPGKP